MDDIHSQSTILMLYHRILNLDLLDEINQSSCAKFSSAIFYSVVTLSVSSAATGR